MKKRKTPETKVRSFSPVRPHTSPWDVMRKAGLANVELKRAIKESFRPSQVGGDYNLVPLPDQSTGELYVSHPTETIGQSAIWLDPSKWKNALEEFAQFARKFGGKKIQLLVTFHQADTFNESVIVTPIVRSGTTYLAADNNFSLNLAGEVSFGSEKYSVHSLGLLNPARANQEARDFLIKSLTRA